MTWYLPEGSGVQLDVRAVGHLLTATDHPALPDFDLNATGLIGNTAIIARLANQMISTRACPGTFQVLRTTGELVGADLPWDRTSGQPKITAWHRAEACRLALQHLPRGSTIRANVEAMPKAAPRHTNSELGAGAIGGRRAPTKPHPIDGPSPNRGLTGARKGELPAQPQERVEPRYTI